MIETSGHMPECPVAGGSCCPWMGDCDCQCLCDLIRAVEDRVEESMDRSITHTLRLKQAEAFTNGLDAARNAVAARHPRCVHPCEMRAEWDDALGAIDALREEKQ